MLDVKSLRAGYGRIEALHGIDLGVRRGELVALVGANGAGKSTLLRALSGVQPATGSLSFDDREIQSASAEERVALGIVHCPEGRQVFGPLSVEDNLLAILETMRDLDRRARLEKAHQLISQFGLGGQRKQLARTLSGGERRKLEIARALVTEPKLIMLDEPFSGVDPKAVEDLQAEILHLKRDRGIAILLTDHNVRETLRVTDRSYIINDGRKLAEGSPRDIIRDPQVRATYLGSSFRGDEFDR